jgi:hypothetical protein
MTEMVVAIFLAVLFVGGIAALFYRIFSRLREIEETFIDEALDTQELVVDVLCEMRKLAKALNVADEDSEQNEGG